MASVSSNFSTTEEEDWHFIGTLYVCYFRLPGELGTAGATRVVYELYNMTIYGGTNKNREE
jgi:hypothetical protein